jgi:hypothetical protein
MAKNNLTIKAALKPTSTAKTKECPKKKTPNKRSLKQIRFTYIGLLEGQNI